MDTNELKALDKRIIKLYEELEELKRNHDEIHDAYEKLRRKELQEGSLAPLMKALVYHHRMNNGWTKLVRDGGTPNEFRTEFVRMREVVIQYEYAVLIVLGINPSPLAEP